MIWLAKERNIQALLTELYVDREGKGDGREDFSRCRRRAGGRAKEQMGRCKSCVAAAAAAEGEEETESALSHSTTLDAIQKESEGEGGGRDASRMRKTVRISYMASIDDMPLIAQRTRIKAYKVGAFDLTG